MVSQSSTTTSMTKLFSGESPFYNKFWNFSSKSLLQSSENKLTFFASPISRSMLSKMMEGILSSSISSIGSFMMFLSGETMRTITFAPFAFLLPSA